MAEAAERAAAEKAAKDKAAAEPPRVDNPQDGDSPSVSSWARARKPRKIPTPLPGLCPDETCRVENPNHVNPNKAKFCILCGTKLAPPPTPASDALSQKTDACGIHSFGFEDPEDAETKTETPAAFSQEAQMMLPFPYGANALPDCRPVVCACHGCSKCSTGLAGPYRDDAFLADMEALEDFRKLRQFETLILRAATD